MGNLEDLAAPAVREELLKAEVAAWLHDMKKCRDEHVVENTLLKGNLSKSNVNTSTLGSIVSSLPAWKISFLGEDATLTELIDEDIRKKSNKWLVQALKACHS